MPYLKWLLGNMLGVFFFSKFIGLSTPADGKSCLVKLAASYHV